MENVRILGYTRFLMAYKPLQPFRHRGFTLVELMVTVAIIGILASIAIPKFANLVRKAKQGQTKGNLGSIRSALSVYYADMEGWFPAYDFSSGECPPGQSGSCLGSITKNGKYLAAIPTASMPSYHIDTNMVIDDLTGAQRSTLDFQGWGYVGSISDPNYGTVWVLCLHTDSQGTFWSSY